MGDDGVSIANLNRAAGPDKIDLSATIGKKPVILFYWIAGNPRADKLFQEVQALTEEIGAEKIKLYGMALQQPGDVSQHVVAGQVPIGVIDPLEVIDIEHQN